MVSYSKTFVRTDRNGTKYYKVVDVCPRCGGRGDYVLGINYGVCFLCHGTGTKEYVAKEYTPEHEAKLEARRKARDAKRLEEKAKYAEEHAEEIRKMEQGILERRYADYGCGKDGIGYIHEGNTYPVRKQIKKQGGRWICGVWICPVEVEGNGVTTRKLDLRGHLGCGSVEWIGPVDLWDLISGLDEKEVITDADGDPAAQPRTSAAG